ncbi:predicted protein [Postia placenta Mad-698-R]|uniref:Uncharacterized protein n=1 Tax=Postia placenta MAD-698-R-SB12 TaxID=670580 RepID=A0A1X6NEX6_9APHY|nr:hypothetical protein POSPLADRAFT_1127288 [Postia placenta MAD-698-R-SB12]EED80833.1 predicted protein [Postia placenta Mad-698-R]OSX67189.1 hypothetical protein POSPLADRAFT_1127288 [Postia placenta MAD-698-R-SB12]
MSLSEARAHTDMGTELAGAKSARTCERKCEDWINANTFGRGETAVYCAGISAHDSEGAHGRGSWRSWRSFAVLVLVVWAWAWDKRIVGSSRHSRGVAVPGGDGNEGDGGKEARFTVHEAHAWSGGWGAPRQSTEHTARLDGGGRNLECPRLQHGARKRGEAVRRRTGARDHSAGTHVRAYDFIGEQHPLALRGCRRRTIRDSVRSDKRTECAMGAIVRGAGAHAEALKKTKETRARAGRVLAALRRQYGCGMRSRDWERPSDLYVIKSPGRRWAQRGPFPERMDSSTLHSAAARSRRRPIAFRAVGTRALRYSCRAGSGDGALRPLQAAGKRRNVRMDVSFRVAVWLQRAAADIGVSGIRHQEYVPSNVHAAQAGMTAGAEHRTGITACPGFAGPGGGGRPGAARAGWRGGRARGCSPLLLLLLLLRARCAWKAVQRIVGARSSRMTEGQLNRARQGSRRGQGVRDGSAMREARRRQAARELGW